MPDRAASGWLLARVVLFTLLVPGSVVALVPHLVLDGGLTGPVDIDGLALLGVLPIALGVAVYLRCAAGFLRSGGTPAPVDPPRGLVTDGPYRYVRNPIYVAVLSILLGEALLFEDRRLLAWSAVMASVFFLVVVLSEERVLGRQFGEAYARYRAAVPRWLPSRSGWLELHRRSFLAVGALVCAAGALANLARLTVGLPVLETPPSIHAALVLLPGWSLAGCVAYARRLDLGGWWRKLLFTLATTLLAVTVALHAYSLLTGDNRWYGVFPPWYSGLALFVYGGLAVFLRTRRVPGR